jgi:transcriptional regulator with XRE-family HTH domain
MNIGPLIRSYRKKQKLTLKAVAEKAGISEGFLSQVENNVNSPSVVTLQKICGAIGISTGDLLTQAENQQRLVRMGRSDWRDIEIPDTGFATRRFFSPKSRVTIDSAILAIAPGKSIPVRKYIKNTQEVLCVLKGTLELVHGEKTERMKEGDAVHYWAEPKRQSITNIGKGVAYVLWVGTL